MTEPSITGPLLAVDIGNYSTHAFLFEKMGERYCLTGMGKAPTTLGRFGHNVKLGVRLAVEEVQALTGRILLNAARDLIQPVSRVGDGVDQCVLTISLGQRLNILIAGLERDGSLENGRRVASIIEARALKLINLEDERKPEEIIDEILQFQPDIIILNNPQGDGFPRPPVQLIEPILFAYFQFADVKRPQILYIGDQALKPSISALFDNAVGMHFSNVVQLKSMGDLDVLEPIIARVVLNIYIRELVGLEDIISWTPGRVFLSPIGLMRILDSLTGDGISDKGVLGVSINCSSALTAAEFQKQVAISVVSDFGEGFQLHDYRNWISQISIWLTLPGLSEERILEYLLNKSIYPLALPESKEDAAIQDALLRVIIRSHLQHISAALPVSGINGTSYFSWFEPILVIGNMLTDIANPGRLCLTLLDGIQPTGITSFFTDSHDIANSLGAIVGVFPELAMQLLDADIFSHLATVVSPIGNAPSGAQVLRVRFTLDDGVERVMDVKQGELEVIPLPRRQVSQIQLQPFHRYDIGMGGAGRGGLLRVMGSELGLVIDARGRPLVLPEKLERRSELYRKWHWMLASN